MISKRLGSTLLLAGMVVTGTAFLDRNNKRVQGLADHLSPLVLKYADKDKSGDLSFPEGMDVIRKAGVSSYGIKKLELTVEQALQYFRKMGVNPRIEKFDPPLFGTNNVNSYSKKLQFLMGEVNVA